MNGTLPPGVVQLTPTVGAKQGAQAGGDILRVDLLLAHLCLNLVPHPDRPVIAPRRGAQGADQVDGTGGVRGWRGNHGIPLQLVHQVPRRRRLDAMAVPTILVTPRRGASSPAHASLRPRRKKMAVPAEDEHSR